MNLKKVFIFMILFQFLLALLVCSAQENVSDNEGDGASKGEGEEIEVVLGIDTNIDLDFVPDRQIQIGSQAILQTQYIVGRKEITLKGLKPGKTNVTLRDNAGNIKKIFQVKVTTNAQSKVLQEVTAFLDGIEGVEIKIIGDTITLVGHIVIPEDIGRIIYLLGKYPEIVNLVELSPHSQQVIAKKMQEEIHASGLKNVTVRVLNKLYVLEGVVRSKEEDEKALKIAKIYLPDDIESLSRRVENRQVKFVVKDPIQDFIVVDVRKEKPPIPKLVKITAQFVELTKSFTDVFGFKWSPLLAASGGTIQFGKTASGAVSTQSEGSLSGVISQLFPKLSAAKSAGHARVLQSGVVVVENNVEANLEKTEQATIELGQGEFSKAHTVNGGFSLSVKPEIIRDEMIKLKLAISSNKYYLKGGSDGTETQKNMIKTEMIVKSMESAVIGGVFGKQDQVNYDKDPPGGVTTTESGQPLFSFIRSKSQVSNKSQFVMFVTPELIVSASAGTEEIKRKFRRSK